MSWQLGEQTSYLVLKYRDGLQGEWMSDQLLWQLWVLSGYLTTSTISLDLKLQDQKYFRIIKILKGTITCPSNSCDNAPAYCHLVFGKCEAGAWTKLRTALLGIPGSTTQQPWSLGYSLLPFPVPVSPSVSQRKLYYLSHITMIQWDKVHNVLLTLPIM